MWPFKNPDDAFRDSVCSEFGTLASELGVRLEQIEPFIFGFRTSCAVLTIGAYPGHFRSICVKLRSSGSVEPVLVKDGADIGLANIDQFMTGDMSEIYHARQKWAAKELELEVKALAKRVREIALPFLTSANADWDGVRDVIAARFKRSLEEQPWLKRYSQNT